MKTPPTLAIIVATTMLGCIGDGPLSTAPSGGANGQPQVNLPPPAATHTLTGVVSESTATGVRKLAGARISLWVQEATSGHHWGFFPTDAGGGNIPTDADGRYRVSGLPNSVVLVYAQVPGHQQPCAALASLAGDTTALDVQLIPDTALVKSSQSPSMSAASPTLTGIVYEVTAEGRRPVEGALIYLEWLPDLVTATTMSDRDGRYSFCRVPSGYLDIAAAKAGFTITDIALQFSVDARQDLEMKRP